MENHIPKVFIDQIKHSKALAQEFLQRSKTLLQECEKVNIVTKCLIDVNKIILVSDDFIHSIQKVMDSTQSHKLVCKNEQCKKLCNDLIYAGKEVIKSLDFVEIECNHELKSCIDNVKIAIERTEIFLSLLEKVKNS